MYLNELIGNLPPQHHEEARRFLAPFLTCLYPNPDEAPDKAFHFSEGPLAIGYMVLGQPAANDTPEIATRRQYCAAMGHALAPDGDPIGRFHEAVKLWRKFAEQWGGDWERELAELVATARTWMTFIGPDGVVMRRDETRPFKVRVSNVADLRFGTRRLLDFGNDAIRETWTHEWTSYRDGSPAGTPWLCRTNGGWGGGASSGVTMCKDGVILYYQLTQQQMESQEVYKIILRLMDDQPVYVLKCEHKHLQLFIPGIAAADIHDGRKSILRQKWVEGFTSYAQNLLPIELDDYKVVKSGESIEYQ